MKYRALISFSGQISMAMGDVAEIADKSIAKDLLKAGYITELRANQKKETKTKKRKGDK